MGLKGDVMGDHAVRAGKSMNVFIYLLRDQITGSVRTDGSLFSFVGFFVVFVFPCMDFSFHQGQRGIA